MTRFHHHPIRWFVTGKKNDGLIIKTCARDETCLSAAPLLVKP